MFDKAFKLDVSATAPFAYEKDDKTITGITIVGTVRTDDMDFLNDILVLEKLDGLRRIFTGEIPIKEQIPIAFLQTEGLLLDFPECEKKINCEITDIETGELDPGGNIVAKLKIKCNDLNADRAGKIVSNLKNVVEIKIVRTQEELPFDGNSKETAIERRNKSGTKTRQLTDGTKPE
jgi:hypothetical protein